MKKDSIFSRKYLCNEIENAVCSSDEKEQYLIPAEL